jgi:hypothetical protein
MDNLKKIMRYVFLGILVLLALAGIPIVSFLPRNKDMDVDNQTKTELVEGKDDAMETVAKE